MLKLFFITVLTLLIFLSSPGFSAAKPGYAKPPTAVKKTAKAKPAASAPVADKPVVEKIAPVVITQRSKTSNGALVAKLSNGMTVIIREVHTAPVVCVRGYVRTGGIYEGKWLGCGLSHLCEHLVAKDTISGEPAGTKSGQKVSAVNRVTEIGGQSNAYTSLAHTCYYISAGADKTDDCISIIADQLGRPDITRKDFQREHGVVQRELEMGKDDPRRIIYYAHMANFYGTHPAAVPVIGFPEPLAAVTYEDVMAYHQKMYAPQNMIFVVVGDIDTDAALKQVVKSMQGFTQTRQPEFNLPKVRDVVGVRRRTLQSSRYREDAEMLSFMTIDLLDPDLYALDLLSCILTNGKSSRLVRSLQFDKRLVTSIASYSSTPAWGKGNFTFQFRTAPGKADTAETALLAELRGIVKNGVTESEIARAKQQMISQHVRSQQTMKSIAGSLGTDMLAAGIPTFSEHYTKNIQNVTAKQILDVAKKYFRFDDMVITRVVPLGQKQTTATTQPAKQTSSTEVYKLPNGLTVVLNSTDAIGLVSMVMGTKGGILLETPADNGIGTLMMGLSTRGAAELSADEIAEFFNAAGGSIHGICGDNSFTWSASVLSDNYKKAFDIFADVVLHPTFPQKQLDTYKPLALAAIKRIDEDWNSLLGKYFRANFFTGGPWKMPRQGDAKFITAATVKQLAKYHTKVLKPGSSVLAVYGKFDPAVMKTKIAKSFGTLPAGKDEITQPPVRKVAPEGELHVLQTKTKQAGIIVAVPGTTMADTKDRLALTLLDTIISGYHYPNGWLHTELRGKKLVYVVHAYHKTGFIPGAFLTYAGTQPEKAKQVVDIIHKNYRKAANYLPTQQELDLAINTIVTAEVLNNQTLDDLATAAVLNELYGLGVDWPRKLKAELQGITPKDVQRVAKKYLSGGYVTVVITPQPQVLSGETISETE
ncbi:MAG: insulinase family protein [Phycisphaerae bacterium]|nr:insulinase family protein [Phycisphaerae bacterium]